MGSNPGAPASARRHLVIEWVTGGGLLGRPLPPGLAAEGAAMAERLATDLADLPNVEVALARDPRLPAPAAPVRPRRPASAGAPWPQWRAWLSAADIFWPIAPETGGAMEGLARLGRSAAARVVASDPATLRLAASKRATARRLAEAGVPAAPTVPLGGEPPPSGAGWAVKPDDGAGAEATLRVRDAPSPADVAGLAARGLVVQPWLEGEPLSLSLLCAAGRARLLACNRQLVAVDGRGRVAFEGVVVGGAERHRPALEPVASGVARALPGLFGPVGVDLVLAPGGPVVLEVNPRLTTAYVGLRGALGANPAGLAVALLERPVAAIACPLPARVVTVQVGQPHP